MLDQGDAEFLLEKAADGRLKIRIGQIWKIPERKGQTILQCDYDNTKKIDQKTIRKRLTKAGIKVCRITQRVSPSGTGIHCLIWISGRFDRWQCIALQGILESDPEREAQNFRRAGQAKGKWKENWQALFTKGEKK